MIQIELFLLVLLCLYVIIQLIAFAMVMAYQSPPKWKVKVIDDLPFVSILIAARNEELNIRNCLLSIHQLNYPKNKFEIIVGDDASEDLTLSIVQSLKSEIPNLHVVSISGKLGMAQAKANVLAHLVHEANSDYIFVTDADIIVKADWIHSLLPSLLNVENGIVSNATMVNGQTFFAKMQQLEWMLGFGNIIAFEQMGLKSTAVGNNMAFTKEAYFKSGGYEKIPFSVTEDFQLFRYIRNASYKGLTILNADGLNLSEAQHNFMKLLHQRKRWMIGAQDLPLIWKLIFLLQGLFFPFIVVLAFIHLKLALILFLFKAIFQSFFILRISALLKVKRSFLYLPAFTVYQEFMILLMSVFYLLPIQMDWKNRKY